MMGYPSVNSVRRHLRFAFSLILALLFIILLAPKPGNTLFDSLSYLWRCEHPSSHYIMSSSCKLFRYAAKGYSMSIDQNYNPGVSLWGDLHRTLKYNEGQYQEAIRMRKESIQAWGGPDALNL